MIVSSEPLSIKQNVVWGDQTAAGIAVCATTGDSRLCWLV